MRCSNCGFENEDGFTYCRVCNSALNNNFNRVKKKKKSPIILVYILISLIVIGGATFYEIKRNESNNNGIYVTKKNLVLKENEKYLIKVDEELNGKLSFESSDHSVVDVSDNGLIDGRKTGKAVIIIRDEDNNLVKTINIRVVKKSSMIKSDSNVSSTTDISGNNETDINNNTNNDTNNDNNSDVNNQNNNNNNDNSSINNNGDNSNNNSNGDSGNNTTENNGNASKEVYVEEIILDKNSTILFLNDSITIKATIVPANAINKDLTWSSSDSSIATVNNGTIKGLKVGKVKIKVSTSTGVTALCDVEVKEKPKNIVDAKSISLNASSKTIDVGSSFNLTYTISPSNTTDKTVSWSSSDNSIATVNNGTVKGIKAGTATITVKTSNGKVSTCKVTVKDVEPSSITLNTTSSNIFIGDTLTLVPTISPSNATNKTVTWSSSDNSVATVNNGVVHGIKAGTATITAKTSNGKVSTCSVTVKNVEASSVSLNVTSNTIYVGSTLTLVATISPGNVTEKTITWSSSNTSIATVSNGTVKGIKAGSATITARTANGKTATCNVIVKDIEPTGITLNNVSKMVKIGETFQLTATVSPSNAKDKSVTWSVSNSSIATVNNGLVKGVSIGTAIVTAKTSNGITAKSTIIVLKSGTTTYYIGDTLKYWMQEPTENYAMTHVWVKDPSSQMRTAICNTSNTYQKELSSTIVNNEIKNKNLSGKAMIGIDVTSAAQVIVYEGRTLRNKTGTDLSDEEALNYIYGLDSNNNLRYFRFKPNDINYNKSIYNQIISSGIKYSFSFRPALVANGKSLKSEYSSLSICNGKNARQALCQIDTNNYLIITNTGTKITGYPEDERDNGFTCDELKDIFIKNKCQNAVSLDGGGSIVLFYKKRTNSVTYRKDSIREKIDVLYFVEQ